MVAIKLTKSLTPARIPKFFNLDGNGMCRKAKRTARFRALPGLLKKGSIYPRLSNSEPIWISRRPAGKGGYPRVLGREAPLVQQFTAIRSTLRRIPQYPVFRRPQAAERSLARAGGQNPPPDLSRRARPHGTKGRQILCASGRRAGTYQAGPTGAIVRDALRWGIPAGAPCVRKDYRNPALRHSTMARSCDGEDV